MKLVWTQPHPDGGTLARVWLVNRRYHWDANPTSGCCVKGVDAFGSKAVLDPITGFNPQCKGLRDRGKAIKKARSQVGKWSYE